MVSKRLVRLYDKGLQTLWCAAYEQKAQLEKKGKANLVEGPETYKDRSGLLQLAVPKIQSFSDKPESAKFLPASALQLLSDFSEKAEP